MTLARAHADQYERFLEPVRLGLRSRPELVALLSDAVPPGVLLRFLIEYSARGYHMTKSVEDWMTRAGTLMSSTPDLAALGRSILEHSEQERGHDLLLVADTEYLVDAWNATAARPPLDARELLDRPIPATIWLYRSLAEWCLADARTAPALVAMQKEIERLSLTIGAPFLRNCAVVLGHDIVAQLSFIREHVELDADHDEANRRELDSLLSARPGDVQQLVDVGCWAVDLYGQFLADCYRTAAEDGQVIVIAP